MLPRAVHLYGEADYFVACSMRSDAIRFMDLMESTQTRIVSTSAAGWEK